MCSPKLWRTNDLWCERSPIGGAAVVKQTTMT